MENRFVLIGCGTVGQGLLEILAERGEALARSEGGRFPLVGVCDLRLGSAASPGGIDPAAALKAATSGSFADLPGGSKECDALGMIREVDAEIVVETTFTDLSTGQPALAHMQAALEAGRSAVTTNKGPVALAYRELRDLATDRDVALKLEGTVMSGTPVLSLAQRDLAGDTILEIRGILNGTTNFILSRMEAGDSYDSALAEAQRMGVAEAKPDADVEGLDAVAKVMILSAALLGTPLRAAQVACEGITRITPGQIQEAAAQGKRYKLLGSVRRTGDGIEAGVGPVALDVDDPLAGVGGVMNAIHFRTELLGDLTVVGPGAGRRETGFALLSDLLSVHRWRSANGGTTR